MKIRTEDLNLYYGRFQALRDIDLAIRPNAITAIIGPSGCGKSTLLRTFNRLNELIDGVRITGRVYFDDTDIFTGGIEPTELRKKIGMVFQRPNAFPLSVLANITYGPRVHRSKNKKDLVRVVERTLDAVHLWDELKDRLGRPALELTLEQQQRLCVARLLAVEPEVLLMDEPCSALDPIATLRLEELMFELKKNYTIVIVTHNMQQAARVSDETGFMLLGELVEFGATERIFTKPADVRTENYIAGKFG